MLQTKKNWKNLVKPPTSQRNLQTQYKKYQPARNDLQHFHNTYEKFSVGGLREKSKIGSDFSKSKIRGYNSVSFISGKQLSGKEDNKKKKQTKIVSLQKNLQDVITGLRQIIKNIEHQIENVMTFWINEIQTFSKNCNVSIDVLSLKNKFNSQRNSGNSRISSEYNGLTSRSHKYSESQSSKLTRNFIDSKEHLKSNEIIQQSKANFMNKYEDAVNKNKNGSSKQLIGLLPRLRRQQSIDLQKKLKLSDEFKKFGKLLKNMKGIVDR